MFNFENHSVKRLLELVEDHAEQVNTHDYLSSSSSIACFEKAATLEGFIKLGEGHFAQAWTHELMGNHVVKLGFKKEDSGAAYAAFCRDNQGLVGIPKIHGIKRLSACYVVLLDRYYNYRIATKLDEYTYMSNRERGLPCERLLNNAINDYMAAKGLIYYGSAPSTLQEAEESEGVNNIFSTSIKIRRYFDGLASFDLHDENVMIDSDNNLVITDPVSFVKPKVAKFEDLAKIVKVAHRGLSVKWVSPIFDEMVEEFHSVKHKRPKKPAFLIQREAAKIRGNHK